MRKVQIAAKIISNKQLGQRYFKAVLAAAAVADKARPGQFVMVRPQAGVEPLLRRPLGIHNVCGRNIELLYEVVGPATGILSQKSPGELVDIIGPLGNGFCYEGRNTRGKGRPILVAGGMGVAPLVFLAKKIKKLKPLVLIGAKTKSHILCEKEFKGAGCDIKIATDDGSSGFKGRVTALLDTILRAPNFQLSNIYACGPRLMLEALNHIAQKYKILAQISLEEHMGCGFGACLGCTVNTVNGYKQACKDGPVFDAQEIIW